MQESTSCLKKNFIGYHNFNPLPVSDQIALLRYFANSAGPVQTPQNAASDQGLHCLHTEMSMENAEK